MSASRLVATKLSQLRSLCTAAAAEAAAAVAEVTSEPRKPMQLFQKLAALGATGGSISSTLNEHIMEGNEVNKNDLLRIVHGLLKNRRPDYALQVMEWMENRKMNFSSANNAFCLDLISKVKGVAEAENYFQNLPASAKTKFTYTALLCCYCNNGMEEKALSLFKEMEELNLAHSTLHYNNLMVLYLIVGKLEKIPSLVEEMKQRNISLNTFSYKLWMQSYARQGDTEGVERVYHETLENNGALCDWTVCSNLVAHYIKAGLDEKARSALKKLESVMDSSNREAFHYLMTMYTNLSNATEVYRLWHSLKTAFQITTHTSYRMMLSCLRRLKDLEGMKRVFDEWESKCTLYDHRLVRTVIYAYLEHDRLEEAEDLFKEASKKVSKPFLKGMELFIIYFLKRGQVDRCVEFLEAAVAISKNETWIPHLSTIAGFLTHFDGNGDVETAHKLFSLLKEVDNLKATAYHLLLKAYAAAGKTDPGLLGMLEEDGVKINDELEELLQEVCPLQQSSN
ncbi:hypothetical protein SAY86_006622 [Trapa natans]|uniref:Pentatricopeptide repeat-containing protein n=1 Tax=Trapa natans TaxID=22666 RepID=A0AAN7L6Y7_TRANT|nr:hypothetical protein SAY86_006622 [Trapa natans]